MNTQLFKMAKRMAVLLGVLIPLTTAAAWIFALKDDTKANAAAIVELKVKSDDRDKMFGEIRERLSRIEGKLDTFGRKR